MLKVKRKTEELERVFCTAPCPGFGTDSVNVLQVSGTFAESYNYADFSSKQAPRDPSASPRSGDKLQAQVPELRCLSLTLAQGPPWPRSGSSSCESPMVGSRLSLGGWHLKVSGRKRLEVTSQGSPGSRTHGASVILCMRKCTKLSADFEGKEVVVFMLFFPFKDFFYF